MPTPKPLRIAVVTTFPPGTGTLNEYAYHFVRCLVAKPEVAEVILLVDELPDGAAYPEPRFDAPALANITVVPCWSFGSPRNALRIRRAVREARPDLVLFNIQFASFGKGKVPATLGLLTPALLRAGGVPVITLLHNIMETVDLQSAGFASNPLMTWVIRSVGNVVTRMLLRSDLLAVTIPKYVEILEHKYGADNVVLAPHGAFDDAPLPVQTTRPERRQIMTFGKFGTYKKVETLIEAYRLVAERVDQPLELVIAGTDSPNTPGYLDAVRERYADVPHIRFTGYVAESDVPGLFYDASVVVFPYTSTTGSSGVLHQAGSYGKAVVLPQLGDLAELVTEEGYAGEFFEPTSAASLAAALERLLTDPARRQAIETQNYTAAHGLPMADVVDWYILHTQTLLAHRERARSKAARPQIANQRKGTS